VACDASPSLFYVIIYFPISAGGASLRPGPAGPHRAVRGAVRAAGSRVQQHAAARAHGDAGRVRRDRQRGPKVQARLRFGVQQHLRATSAASCGLGVGYWFRFRVSLQAPTGRRHLGSAWEQPTVLRRTARRARHRGPHGGGGARLRAEAVVAGGGGVGKHVGGGRQAAPRGVAAQHRHIAVAGQHAAAPAQRRRVRPHLPPRCTVSARAEAGRSSDTRRETHCCGPSDTRAPHAAQSVRQDRRCAVVCRRAPRRAHRRQTLAQAQRAARAAAPSGRRCGRAARRLRGLRGHSQRGRGRRRCGWQGVRRLWRGRAARCQLPWRLPALVDAGMVTASAREQTPARSAQVQAPQQNGVAV